MNTRSDKVSQLLINTAVCTAAAVDDVGGDGWKGKGKTNFTSHQIKSSSLHLRCYVSGWLSSSSSASSNKSEM